jgi:uncharacterized protein
MEEILEKLTHVNGIQGTLIVGKDGLVIAYSGEINTDPDFLGATVADFFTTAENIMEEKFGLGGLEQICIEANQGKYYFNGINTDTFLVVITDEKVNLGLIRIEMKAASESLREVL